MTKKLYVPEHVAEKEKEKKKSAYVKKDYLNPLDGVY